MYKCTFLNIIIKKTVMENKYEIKTMQDVVDCVTTKNIDNFLIDFRNFIESAISIKEVFENIKTDGFVWTDDGKNKCSNEIKL
jgi:hypothetical protein